MKDSCPASPCRRRLNEQSLRQRHLSAFVSTLLLLSLLAGCGTGEYEKRLSERNSKIMAQVNAKWNLVGPAQELAGTPISIALPKSFTDAPLPENGDARRVKPGIITIPGQKTTREGFVQDSEGGQLSYYCYVGVTNGPLNDVAIKVQNDLKGKDGKVVTDWSDFQGDVQNGPPNKWRRLRFEGNQEFYYKSKNGQEQFPAVAGLLEVYLYEAGPQVVVVAWRMPVTIEKNADIARLAPLVAGSVSVKK
jgi:hypothetical protein